MQKGNNFLADEDELSTLFRISNFLSGFFYYKKITVWKLAKCIDPVISKAASPIWENEAPVQCSMILTGNHPPWLTPGPLNFFLQTPQVHI